MDFALDGIDRRILSLLQDNSELPLAKIGEQVGLSAPAIQERIRKLEEHGVILGYRAIVDARRVGKDVTAFIGVSIDHPKKLIAFERALDGWDGVLECHHITGAYSLLLKVKIDNTSALETLISQIRSEEGVLRTETMIVLSTHSERTQIPVGERTAPAPRAARSHDKKSQSRN